MKHGYATDPTLLMTAVIYGVSLRMALFSGLFGVLLLLLIVLSLARYGHAVLYNVAHAKPLRAVSSDFFYWFGDYAAVLHTLLFFLAMFFLGTTPLFTSPGAVAIRLLLLAVLIGVFPASAAIVAVTRNIGAALEPGRISFVLRTMGNRYWALLGACAVLVLAAGLTISFIARIGGLWLILADCVSVWAFLALFVAIGGAIGEFRSDFELVGEPEKRQHQIDRTRERDRQWYLDRAYESLRCGNVAQGFRPIRELLKAEHDSLEILYWVFERMLTWDDTGHAMVVAERYIERLIEERQLGEALEVLKRCRRLQPGFRPSPENQATLIAFARQNGWHLVADALTDPSR